ncbi:hypothetical protein P5609_002660 [Bacillus licheniformis]
MAALVKPAINWKERLAVIGFMFVSISLFTFIIYVFINKPKKDQSAAPMQHRRENLLEETQKTVHALFLLRRHTDCGNIRVFHVRTLTRLEIRHVCDSVCRDIGQFFCGLSNGESNAEPVLFGKNA